MFGNKIMMIEKGAILSITYVWSIVLVNGLFLGFLPSEYFGWLSLFYGFLGNAVYSLIMIFRGLLILAEDTTGTARPFNKYTWILLFTRPFGAAVMNFVVSPILIVLSRNLNSGFTDIIKGEGAQLLIGLTVGILFEYFIKKEFMDGVAKKITNKIIKKGE